MYPYSNPDLIQYTYQTVKITSTIRQFDQKLWQIYFKYCAVHDLIYLKHRNGRSQLMRFCKDVTLRAARFSWLADSVWNATSRSHTLYGKM